MLFNSIDFIVFLPIVFTIYWTLTKRRLKLQNLLIVISSYVFYGWWDWRFLSLIFISTFVDFIVGILLKNERKPNRRKVYLLFSIIVNLGFLGFFKYYNFFINSFSQAFTLFGDEIQPYTLNIILPVGISFYTFQTLSYSIDVYRKKIKPTYDIIAFAAFVSFFPQLVAGPIERASHLLPQFFIKREFKYCSAVDGMRQILWGLFKKIVIADNCAVLANYIFDNSMELNGSTLVLGALFFTFQIYGDFSGYSDIAIGTSRLFGFNLRKNFAFPYFSRDIAEFWRRWHISLSSWFRDYLYIPLGGSRVSTWKKVRNVFIIFLVSGFWHGANWTFIAWGGLNALFFLPLILSNRNRDNINIVASGKLFPKVKDVIKISTTFSLTVIAWIFFRAESIGQALVYIREIFSSSLFTYPTNHGLENVKLTLILILFFLLVEWFGRENPYAIASIGSTWKKHLRYPFYYFIMMLIFWFSGKEEEFIYFQF